MQRIISDGLQKLGLTDGEAKVYEALLSIGSSAVGPVVKRSGVAYSNIYEILQRLTEKGLVSSIVRGRVRHFQAAQPNRITDYLDQQEEKLQENRKLLQTMLPTLNQVQQAEFERMDAQVFSGQKGIKSAYDIMIRDTKKGEQGLYFFSYEKEQLTQMFTFYSQAWREFEKKGTSWRGIVNTQYKKNPVSQHLPKFVKERFVDFPVPANIDVIKNYVLITTWSGRPVGILIRSKEIADGYRRYFEAVWKIAKP